jgi:hypothetical protein
VYDQLIKADLAYYSNLFAALASYRQGIRGPIVIPLWVAF